MGVTTLECRECQTQYPADLSYVCKECFGPLDVVYDYSKLALKTGTFEKREKNLWRYHELLPINDKNKIVDLGAGYTPLHRADRLAKRLGLKNLFIKNDTVNPTFSFKDRPASVAVSKARELGVSAVGSPSTGNLASATAAHAAKAGLPCYIFIPFDIEPAKVVQASTYGAEVIAINGTYDDANKLASQAGELYNIGIVNVNIRPYYVEGSKTLAFEVCEQLGWTPPDHVIVPTGSGALLCAIRKGFKEFEQLGLTGSDQVKITSAQPVGCSPIVDALQHGKTSVIPVEAPQTLAKSLAIGDPGDGEFAIKNVRESGGFGEKADDEELREAIRLLASTEGIFAEPGGVVSVAILRKLIDAGRIDPDERVVCYVTGNGLKTPEAVAIDGIRPAVVEPKLEALAQVIRR